MEETTQKRIVILSPSTTRAPPRNPTYQRENGRRPGWQDLLVDSAGSPASPNWKHLSTQNPRVSPFCCPAWALKSVQPCLSVLYLQTTEKVCVQVWGWKCFRISSSPNHRNHSPNSPRVSAHQVHPQIPKYSEHTCSAAPPSGSSNAPEPLASRVSLSPRILGVQSPLPNRGPLSGVPQDSATAPAPLTPAPLSLRRRGGL